MTGSKQLVVPMEHEGIKFILIKGNVKNINLRVTHDGTVRVSAPRRMPLETILGFISAKKDWIAEHQSKIRPQEGCILCLGEQVQINTLKDANPEQYLKDAAVKVLTERYNTLCSKLDISPVPKLVLLPLKGKYGYYTKAIHEICLNIQLIMVPLECIDYVIVHELIHIKHFDHGKEFHAALQEIIPNERELRSRLAKYILW